MVRRIGYLAVLGGCMVFYFAYQKWFSWFLLVGVLLLPWLSLLLSLPGMLSLRLTAQYRQGPEGFTGYLEGRSRLPQPPFKARLQVTHAITGQTWRLKSGALLPTAHCGQLRLTPVRAWVRDYLGLFSFPVRKLEDGALLLRPRRVPMAVPPALDRYRARVWRPKSGGFAENHELRLYRPGDELHHIHWKLSAKTDSLIIREPSEPVRGLAVLTMVLSGDLDLLDKKLGRLLWLSEYLLSREVPHRILCRTGRGIETFSVEKEGDPLRAVDKLLGTPAAVGEEPPACEAAWKHHIGGDGYDW